MRLKEDGSLDNSFGTAGILESTDAPIQALHPLKDGRLLVGGGFNLVKGVPRPRIARLNPDGAVDMSFDPGTSARGSVDMIAVQEGGEILLVLPSCIKTVAWTPHSNRLWP